MAEGGMRKRGGGGQTASTVVDDHHPDDEEDSKPLLDGDTGGGKGHAVSGAGLTAYRGMIVEQAGKYWSMAQEKMKDVDMGPVYQYWSALRDWLSEVPEMARKNLPDSVTAYFPLPKTPELTPEQEERLIAFIEKNVGIPYTHEEHFDELMELWNLSFPNSEHKPEQSDREWKRLGFQGDNPATDFRAAGVLPVRCLSHFAQMYPDKYQEVLKRSHGTCVEDSFPFACAAINLSHLLTDAMKLKNHSEPPNTDPAAAHMRAMFGLMLEHDANAFQELVCIVFMALDDEWVRTHATYMTFPIVLKTIREKTHSALRHPSSNSCAAFARRMNVNLYGAVSEP
mmetsp:Transcript_15640/g.24499  ORF Transcript_15640/g.24499 Transcript_15640/m.24499 type:complete len:340 (+) Transcript_15640:120-1139(+)